MTARDNFHSSVLTATATKLDADQAAVQTFQASIASATATYLANTPDNRAGAAFATFDAAVKAANATLAASRLANESAKQTSINVPDDTLKATGDVNPT